MNKYSNDQMDRLTNQFLARLTKNPDGPTPDIWKDTPSSIGVTSRKWTTTASECATMVIGIASVIVSILVCVITYNNSKGTPRSLFHFRSIVEAALINNGKIPENVFINNGDSIEPWYRLRNEDDLKKYTFSQLLERNHGITVAYYDSKGYGDGDESSLQDKADIEILKDKYYINFTKDPTDPESTIEKVQLDYNLQDDNEDMHSGKAIGSAFIVPFKIIDTNADKADTTYKNLKWFRFHIKKKTTLPPQESK